jgi:hypothetical protein
MGQKPDDTQAPEIHTNTTITKRFKHNTMEQQVDEEIMAL